MKKMAKKSLSLFLSLIMILSMFAGMNISSSAAGVEDLTYEINDGEVTITGCDENASGDLVIPGTIEDCPVTTIGEDAFLSCDFLTSISIPDSVTSIEGDAFAYCDALTSVTIPDSVTSIGRFAFDFCKALTSITVDKNNKWYTSDDAGALFNKDKTELIQYPIGSSRTEYTIPDSVTSIGDYAFAYCDALTSVTIPYSVTSIGVTPFMECINLEVITVDENNPSYASDDGILYDKDKTTLLIYPSASSLTAYTVPDSVTTIEAYAFFLCSSLQSVTIPDSVATIGMYAFYACPALETVTIGSGITSTGWYVFFICPSLKNVVFSEGITVLDEFLFECCNSLVSIIIPDSVTSIKMAAFHNCTGLKSVTIGNGVTVIGDGAFYLCTALQDVYYNGTEDEWNAIDIGESNDCLEAATIHYGVCSHVNSEVVAEKAATCTEDGYTAGVFCPDCETWLSGHEIINKINHTDADEDEICDICNQTIGVVVESGSCGDNISWVLYEDGKLVISGTGIMAEYSIGKFAPWYESRTAIKEVVIENGVTSIAGKAFEDCTSLTSVTIPDSVTSIGYAAFTHCSSLVDVTIPDGVTSIGTSAFSGCTSLESINIPDGITEISGDLFENCHSLTAISIPERVTSIGAYAFDRCTSLTSVNIPEGVTSIGEYAFAFCPSLAGTITLPDGLTTIEAGTFSGCTALTSMTIPDSVTTIRQYVFSGCTSLENVLIGSGVTLICWDAFERCTSLQSIDIPEQVTELEDRVFEDCTSLERVTIGSGAEFIRPTIFYGCAKLISVTVDENNPFYSSDEYGAFYNKDKTKLIQYPIGSSNTEYIIPDSVTALGESVFYGCAALEKVTIGNGVTEIGDYAFAGCTSLASVKISESVRSIGIVVFDSCIALTDITVDENNPFYSSDDNGVLFNKDKTELIQYSTGSSRTAYTIPNSVTSIDLIAFALGESLTSISIPDSVTNIGEYAFYGCTALQDVYYSGTEDEWNAVDIGENNDRLTSATIHYNVCIHYNSEDVAEKAATCTEDGYTAGVFCPDCETWLSGHEIINKINHTDADEDEICDICNQTIGVVVESGSCGDNISWVLYEDGKLVISGTGMMAEDYVDSSVPWYESRTAIKAVVIKNGITSIRSVAFKDCTSLTSVTIPDSVTSIGWYAFYSCVSLESVTIGSGVTSIDRYAFAKCASLQSIDIPDSVTDIDDGVFEDCSSLENVTIGSGVEYIRSTVFVGCDKLASFTVDENNPFYASEDGVLYNKEKTELIRYPVGSSRTEYTIPDSVTSLQTATFYGCNSLEHIIIGAGVTSLAEAVFSGCTSLTGITVNENNPYYWGDNDGVLFNKDKTELIQYPIGNSRTAYTVPDSVTTIGMLSFAYSPILESVIMTDNVTLIDLGAFAYCESLKSVVISNSITSITESTFAYSPSLESVTIPDGVTSIDYGVFAGCTSLASIVIPDSVTSIDSCVFEGCTALKDIYYAGTADDWNAIDIHVGNDCLEAATIHYQYASHSHDYSSVVTIPETCTTVGVMTYTCSCGDSYTEVIPAAGHTLITVPGKAATCTEAGLTDFIRCAVCGVTITEQETIPALGHSYGEWTVVKEPTFRVTGERKGVCLVCGDTITESIEKLTAINEISDEATAISVSYPEGAFDGAVELAVVQEFDGDSFDIINIEKGNFASQIFDINIMQNGEKVQPKTVVLVSIPLPDGYNAENTFVYHITEDGNLKKMESYCENGYVYFETTHFSVYALVDESQAAPVNCSCNCHSTNPLVKFFYRIARFFRKLFGMESKRICECGVAHW